MRYVLSPKNALVVRGPASVRLLSGQASILGGKLLEAHKIVVGNERQVPIETETHADLDISPSKPAGIFEVQGSTIPRSWKLAANALEQMKEGKVMVIGATDVGKSTLCTYLINRLSHSKVNLRIIDADVGQADLGPPTTIGRASRKAPITSLVELVPELLVFIGHTSPKEVEGRLIEGIQRLSADGEQSLTIVNTDGWILDPAAILFKIDLIAAINPDLVLGLAKGTELQPILSRSRVHPFNVEAANDVLPRSKHDRRQIRTAGYRRYLQGAGPVSISLREVQLSAPRGIPFPGTLRGREFDNLIVGLLDEKGYLIQIGVLLYTEAETVRVYSRPAQGVRRIELGYIKLATTGKELGFLES